MHFGISLDNIILKSCPRETKSKVFLCVNSKQLYTLLYSDLYFQNIINVQSSVEWVLKNPNCIQKTKVMAYKFTTLH